MLAGLSNLAPALIPAIAALFGAFLGAIAAIGSQVVAQARTDAREQRRVLQDARADFGAAAFEYLTVKNRASTWAHSKQTGFPAESHLDTRASADKTLARLTAARSRLLLMLGRCPETDEAEEIGATITNINPFATDPGAYERAARASAIAITDWLCKRAQEAEKAKP